MNVQRELMVIRFDGKNGWERKGGGFMHYLYSI